MALGRIGGTKAAKALSKSLTTAPEAVRPAVAQGCILCAERFIAQGKRPEAVKLYDTVRVANVPRQKQLEAIRGAILARQSAGLPLLLEQLRSPDKALFGIGLSTARELPGRDVTEALAAELRQCSPDRQSFLLLALADRTDAAVMPAVLQAASSGSQQAPPHRRRRARPPGNIPACPCCSMPPPIADADLAQAALAALARLPGNEVDAELLSTASPPLRARTARSSIILAGQRHIDRALPVIVRSAEDPDAGVRTAAVQAIGILGTRRPGRRSRPASPGDPKAKERGDIEMALLAISGRTGAQLRAGRPPARAQRRHRPAHHRAPRAGLRGGPDALAAVQAAVQDKDETVQDEAVRTLSTWPNNWPEDSAVAEPLLTLAKSDAKNTHQVLALRGYLQYLQANKQLKATRSSPKSPTCCRSSSARRKSALAIAAIGTAPTPARWRCS